ncbi:transcriptional regulator, TrmB [Thermofilum pendens Hrk 5]|uniref:Transcriptional regulator, TrmB n=1 Tax=Thermofilum pendens (strain DSM 2475 / Hrk 5) TaxID=368408 RepID=A1RZX5_THEPD|nr:transcriptional regulator, TrmB [Thermofilum pendens Hrk 5]
MTLGAPTARLFRGRGGAIRVIDALVLTLGFEPGPLISAVASAASEGLAEGARVVVLTAGFPDERAERAWLEFQRVVGMMGLARRPGFSVEKREVPLDDFVAAVINVKSLFRGLEDKRVRISITGGMRALGIAVLTAYLLTRWRVDPEVEVYLEGQGRALRLPRLSRVLGVGVPEAWLEVLSALEKSGPLGASDLGGLLGKDRSTVFRYLKRMEEAGLVRQVDGGYVATDLGRLLL